MRGCLSFPLPNQSKPFRRGEHRTRQTFWQLIVCMSVETTSGFAFMDAAPLLEEERHSCDSALVSQRHHPYGVHGASTGSALSAHNDPVDSGEINSAKIFE